MKPSGVAISLAATALLAACTASSASTIPPTTTTTTSTSVPPTTTTSIPLTVVDWDDSSLRIPVGGGWVVFACEGDAPQLCVESGGSVIGMVSATAYPIDPTYDDPLAGFAGLFLTDFAADRAAGCGADYGFLPIGPDEFALGGTPGVAFGFAGTMPDGAESELVLQFAAVVDDQIISLTAIGDADEGCLGRDEFSSFRPGELADFRPYLEAILHATPLPVFEPIGG